MLLREAGLPSRIYDRIDEKIFLKSRKSCAETECLFVVRMLCYENRMSAIESLSQGVSNL